MSIALSWLHAICELREVGCTPTTILYIKLAAAIFQLEYIKRAELVRVHYKFKLFLFKHNIYWIKQQTFKW